MAHSELSEAPAFTMLTDSVVLGLVALATSSVSAVLGLGGGVILMLLLPGWLPLSAIVPIHAQVQFFSNASRVVFDPSHIAWQLFLPLLFGSAVGGLVGAQWVDAISLSLLPFFSGIAILVVTWVSIPAPLLKGSWTSIFLGFYQTGIGMLAGATGPLGAAVLGQYKQQRDWLVVNTGLYMMINHGVRTVVFGFLGFAFGQWWHVIFAMSIGSILGSWIGTRGRKIMPPTDFQLVFRWVVTILACRMIWLSYPEVFR